MLCECRCISQQMDETMGNEHRTCLNLINAHSYFDPGFGSRRLLSFFVVVSESDKTNAPFKRPYFRGQWSQ